MKFTVLWSRNAEDKLALLWLSSVDRRAVTDATNKIDIALSAQAETAGESRPAGPAYSTKRRSASCFPSAEKIEKSSCWTCGDLKLKTNNRLKTVPTEGTLLVHSPNLKCIEVRNFSG
jgi:hypothetical protein